MATEGELQSLGIKAAGQAAANGARREVPKSIKLSNGITLKVKPMPPMLFNSVVNSIPEPEVPKVYMEDKGRDEPNPNHPDYIKAVNERTVAISLATMNLILVACTEIEYLPDGMEGPESDDWPYLAEMAGITFDHSNKHERYLAWLRAYAISTVNDMTQVQTVPLMLAGVSEEEVDTAMDAFRSGEARDSDSGLPDEEHSPDGDNISDISSRPSRRVRRAGS